MIDQNAKCVVCGARHCSCDPCGRRGGGDPPWTVIARSPRLCRGDEAISRIISGGLLRYARNDGLMNQTATNPGSSRLRYQWPRGQGRPRVRWLGGTRPRRSFSLSQISVRLVGSRNRPLPQHHLLRLTLNPPYMFHFFFTRSSSSLLTVISLGNSSFHSKGLQASMMAREFI